MRRLIALCCGVALLALAASCAAPPAATPIPTATSNPAPPPAPTATPSPPTATPPPTPTQVPPTVAAPTTPSPTPYAAASPQDIAGNWLGIGKDGMFQRFNLDGTCSTAASLEGLTKDPLATCTFHFDGTTMIYTEVQNNGLPPCAAKTGTYRVQVLSKDRIKITRIADSCSGRGNTMSLEHQRQP